MNIVVALQCHYFQKRLCWMLSSIAQQKDVDLDKIIIDVAHVTGNGDPTTQDVCNTFRDTLNIRRIEYKDTSRFQLRGFVRNDQLAKARANTWIVFADSDMVYPPEFFSKLFLLVKGHFKDNPHCLYAQRRSTTLKQTNRLIDKETYPSEISNVWDKSDKLRARSMKNVGAGYFQLANIANVYRKFGGKYLQTNKEVDGSWEHGIQRARSDIYFRQMLGREPIPLPYQIHLQHERDSDYGHHIEIQR